MRTKVLPIIITFAAVVLLAGCSGAGTTASDVVAGGEAITTQGQVTGVAPDLGAPAPDAQAQDKAAAGGTVSTAVTPDRQIVKNAYVAMRVDDVARSVFDIHGLIKKRNGLIASEDTQASGESTSSMMTAQIPAADLDAFIADVSKLGAVDSVSVTAQDVTGQVVDLDARIKALQTSVDRMTQLLAQAQRIEDMLAIETQLSQRQAELDSLTAQRKTLGEQVAYSTVTMALTPKSSVSTVEAPGFLSGLASGWAALVSLVTIMFTAAGFLLPFALIALVVLVPLALLVIRQLRRRRSSTTTGTEVPAGGASTDDRDPSLTSS